ncbi:MAG: TetR/AcrR family transcriptional regulator [Chloroflexota bacterium]|nr:TetR/AcrR family transcriptional regulator [Chloroflexota bacterium]
MSRVNDAHTGDGRKRILQSASALFAERGYRGVSISDVAEAARLVKSSIYHHFENKQALYLAVLTEMSRQSREQMEAGAQGATWRERLRGATLVLGRLIGPRSQVFSLIIGGMTQIPADSESKLVDMIAPLRREFAAVLTREIANGVQAGELRDIDPELGAICLVGLVSAALQSLVQSSEQARVNFALDLFLQGALHRENA